jgi:RimJ/RimL family protein N-acetyltransferase
MSEDEVHLQKIGAFDAPWIVKWRNDPANSRWFPKQEPWTTQGWRAWFSEQYLRDPSQQMFTVVLNGNGIGTIGVNTRGGTGEIGRMMLGDKDVARGGHMREAAKLMMSALGLEYWWLEVMPDNVACIKFWQRMGFEVEDKRGAEYVNIYGEHGHYLVMSRYFDGSWGW